MIARLDSHTACGSKRRSAAAAVANALNTVDLVAVVASCGEGDLMESLHHGLAGEPGTVVVHGVAGEAAEAALAGTARRTVMLCDTRDAEIPALHEQFETTLRNIGRTLSGPRTGPRLKVVLVGTCALMEWVQRFPVLLPDEVRYRYILVH